MFTAYVVVTVAAAAAIGGIVVADLVRAPFVLANSAAVGVPQSWIPRLAGLKAAGSAGLLLGLFGVEPVGVAAGSGLVVFFVAAVGVHLRTRALGTLVFPVGFLLLVVAALVLGVLSYGR
ncbi:DoxX family protein [Kitasatospora sp. NPDC054939]